MSSKLGCGREGERERERQKDIKGEFRGMRVSVMCHVVLAIAASSVGVSAVDRF